MAFLEKVLDIAIKKDSVRLVVMNGSRVNPNVIPDKYQDFDIVFYVNRYKEFLKDNSYLNTLGEVLVKQYSSDQRDGSLNIEDSFIYMIQFKDGNRLDLTIRDIKYAVTDFNENSLSKVLLDREGLNLIDNPNESSYYVKPITKEDFNFCINEFYWVCPYIAKGVKREQLFYAIKHLDIIRHELEIMIDWWIGDKHNFKISVGKGKSRYKDLLLEETYEIYKNTYPSLETENIMNALYQAINLFDLLASELANKYSYDYPSNLKTDIIAFLKQY